MCFSLLFSCNIINPDEEIPAYIYIDTIILAPNNTQEEHALTHNFTDAWIFVNDDNIGAYELPCTVPVLKNGKQELKIAAGIKINGVGGFRTDYPFLDFYVNDSTFNLTKEAITTITPIVEYYKTIDFAWIEDFENSTQSIKTTDKSNAEVEIVTNNVKSGNFAYEIFLSDTNDYFEAYSEHAFLLPKGSNDIYLEIDYNVEETFYIGLKAFLSNGTTSESTLVGIQPKLDDNGNPIDVWNKIYVELGSEVNASYNVNALSYQLAFSSKKKPNVADVKLLIDNIKLIHN